jgi:hypothetical protein
MIQVDVHENYRTFDVPGEITYKTNFTCTVCGKISPIYIDIDNILICKGCLGTWIKILNETYLQHSVKAERVRCGEE